LSPDGRFACATCHDAARGYADGQALASGRTPLKRNTLSLVNAGAWRWFAWDGGGDTLWGQSLRPILDPTEMAGSLAHTAARVRDDASLACRYRAAFGAAPGRDDERVAVDAAKALAAFLETLVSGPAPFDRWRDALARGADDPAYPAAARRGAKMFVGTGQCATCHTGPLFSNREFHDIGVPYFVAGGGVDSGRHAGIQRLRQARYGLLGGFNDAPAQSERRPVQHVELQPRNFGEFRVPSLRNLVASAPYMHNGSKASLHDVVRHYSELDPERIHADGERLLKPLRLSETEIDDLVAFLASLDGPVAPSPALPRCPL
jgi:cytochrome c peroxidase